MCRLISKYIGSAEVFDRWLLGGLDHQLLIARKLPTSKELGQDQSTLLHTCISRSGSG